MKILVAIKRVLDPDNANKIKVANGAIDAKGLEYKLNPFDEYALEAALRLTEDGKAPKKREGEVIVVTLGPKDAETQLRSALATGADRAIRIDATDEVLDGRLVAKALAELLDLPMATFAATIKEEAGGVLVAREVDGGLCTLRLKFPALVTVDLRIVAPDSVHSTKTDPAFKYNEGVRFAPLPAIMAAKKKPLDVKSLADVAGGATLASSYIKFEAPPARKAGIKVPDVATLVQKLATEAKVI